MPPAKPPSRDDDAPEPAPGSRRPTDRGLPAAPRVPASPHQIELRRALPGPLAPGPARPASAPEPTLARAVEAEPEATSVRTAEPEPERTAVRSAEARPAPTVRPSPQDAATAIGARRGALRSNGGREEPTRDSPAAPPPAPATIRPPDPRVHVRAPGLVKVGRRAADSTGPALPAAPPTPLSRPAPRPAAPPPSRPTSALGSGLRPTSALGSGLRPTSALGSGLRPAPPPAPAPRPVIRPALAERPRPSGDNLIRPAQREPTEAPQATRDPQRLAVQAETAPGMPAAPRSTATEPGMPAAPRSTATEPGLGRASSPAFENTPSRRDPRQEETLSSTPAAPSRGPETPAQNTPSPPRPADDRPRLRRVERPPEADARAAPTATHPRAPEPSAREPELRPRPPEPNGRPPRGPDLELRRPAPRPLDEPLARERTHTATAFSRPAHAPRIFRIASLWALGLLLLAFALPTAEAAPWALLVCPTEVSFQALAAFALIAATLFAPSRPRRRLTHGALVGALLMPFAAIATFSAVDDGAFGAQPLLARLSPAPAWPATLYLAGATLLHAGLVARGLGAVHRHALLARAAFGLGLAALLALGLGLGVPGPAPLAELAPSMADSAALGDRLAAMSLLPLLLIAAAGLVVTLGPFDRGRRLGAPLGLAAAACAALPLFVLAAFSARAEDWAAALAPLKVALFVLGVLLYAGAALGERLTAPPDDAPSDGPTPA